VGFRLGFAWVVGGREGVPIPEPEVPAGGIVLVHAEMAGRAACGPTGVGGSYGERPRRTYDMMI